MPRHRPGGMERHGRGASKQDLLNRMIKILRKARREVVFTPEQDAKIDAYHLRAENMINEIHALHGDAWFNTARTDAKDEFVNDVIAAFQIYIDKRVERIKKRQRQHEEAERQHKALQESSARSQYRMTPEAMSVYDQYGPRRARAEAVAEEPPFVFRDEAPPSVKVKPPMFVADQPPPRLIKTDFEKGRENTFGHGHRRRHRHGGNKFLNATPEGAKEIIQDAIKKWKAERHHMRKVLLSIHNDREIPNDDRTEISDLLSNITRDLQQMDRDIKQYISDFDATKMNIAPGIYAELQDELERAEATGRLAHHQKTAFDRATAEKYQKLHKENKNVIVAVSENQHYVEKELAKPFILAGEKNLRDREDVLLMFLALLNQSIHKMKDQIQKTPKEASMAPAHAALAEMVLSIEETKRKVEVALANLKDLMRNHNPPLGHNVQGRDTADKSWPPRK